MYVCVHIYTLHYTQTLVQASTWKRSVLFSGFSGIQPFLSCAFLRAYLSLAMAALRARSISTGDGDGGDVDDVDDDDDEEKEEEQEKDEDAADDACVVL
jgi:hypothetical protein